MADARSKGLYVRPITPRIIRKSATVRVNYSLTITLSMVLEDTLILWDNGGNKLWLFSVPDAEQYKYIEGKPCVTLGIAYENAFFKGQDIITVFDHYLTETVSLIEGVYENLVGEFRLYDLGGDTDCYIDFKMKSLGKLNVSGRLGSTFSSNSLMFEFEADQTLLKPLLRSLTVN